jgi:hypothetical protein
MQPYFFPYLPHFALIANCDQWVVFDVVQYKPRSWMNRNRVLHPTGEAPLWITIPLSRSSQNMTISEARVANMSEAQFTVLGKLSHYSRHAPYFHAVTRLVNDTFNNAASDSLADLNIAGLECVCRYLGVPFAWSKASSIIEDSFHPQHPGHWAVYISKLMGATSHLNPRGGAGLFNSTEFATQHISLESLELPPFAYRTTPYEYQANLSVLDVLMWNPPETVSTFLCHPLITHAASTTDPRTPSPPPSPEMKGSLH